ncbi:MAG: 4Fe-4S binding protein [Deltaproteobacteria bacterium]|nr:4Fe-4S binding protein [Deltaproteobacteria bacterium]
MPLSRIAPKRKLVQWLFTLLILGLPFVRMGGESLLRLDAASRTLFFFGTGIRIEEFYLFLIAVLILVFVFLFFTMVFGRVWCGWFCPQTTVSDLVEFLDRKIASLLPGNLLPGILRQVCYLLLSFLISANLIWYFIPPSELLRRLLSGEIGMVAGTTLVTLFFLLYFDIVQIRRTFCKTVCPYGRIQLLTMDRNTLTLEFDPGLKVMCTGCASCKRVCPMGIDIREGLQIECVNCGKCLDACRDVMAKRGREGLIHYTFGQTAEGGGRPLNGRSMLLAGITIALCALMAAGIATRAQATIKIQRGGNGEVRLLPGGGVINFFTAYIENRSARAASFAISLPSPPGIKVDLLGPVTGIRVQPNANRRIDFIVRVTPVPPSSRSLDLHLMRAGRSLSVTPVTLLVK